MDVVLLGEGQPADASVRVKAEGVNDRPESLRQTRLYDAFEKGERLGTRTEVVLALAYNGAQMVGRDDLRA